MCVLDEAIYKSTFTFTLPQPVTSIYIFWYSVTRDHTVLPATHTRIIPAFTPQPQGVIALWLLLITPTHEGMARLS